MRLSVRRTHIRASLVVQWFRVHLPMQRTRVRPLLWEDSTWDRATKPVCRNYWAHVPYSPRPTTGEATAVRSPCIINKDPVQSKITSTNSFKEKGNGRREGGSGWGTHVNPWLIHVNVWQKWLQYCKVISLQLIKINGKKKKKGNVCVCVCLKAHQYNLLEWGSRWPSALLK